MSRFPEPERLGEARLLYKEIIYMGENNRNQAVEPDLNQIRKNKREKLANLQAAGKDPFVITK